MKNIITMVGTSLISNFISEKQDSLTKSIYERFKLKRASEYEQNRTDIDRIKKSLVAFAERNQDASAEIKSLAKLSQELADESRIYLMASDTINSVICAEVIKDALSSDSSKTEIDFSKQNIITGLQVENREEFAHEGMEKLFKRIEAITGGYHDNTVINITGGYKATIPLLTIFSQIYNMPTYYIFEDTDSLMKIPCLPLTVDWKIFERYRDIFNEAEKSNGCLDNWNLMEGKIDYADKDMMLACFEVSGNLADLSTAGRMLWNTYKSAMHMFYCNKETEDSFKKDNNYREYILKIFNKELREAKTEQKNEHFVLDLGTSAPRIFYKVKGEHIYIYRYTRHNKDYERFLNTTAFSGIDDFGPFSPIFINKNE